MASYETGRRSPTTDTLGRLLAACELRVRFVLEPLWEDLDRRVQELDGPLPALDEERWSAMAGSLDDRTQHTGPRPASPRRGPVSWAVDGATALVLHGLAVEPDSLEVVVQLDEALRYWMKAVMLVGVDRRERPVQSWYDLDLEEMTEALDGLRHCRLGFVRVRVVADLPPTVPIAVPWLGGPLQVVTAHEVERTRPGHAEALRRWREVRGVS